MNVEILTVFAPVHAKINLPMVCYALGTLASVWWYRWVAKQKGDYEAQRFRPVKLLLIGLGAMMFGVMTIISTVYVWVLKPVNIEGNVATQGTKKLRLTAANDAYIHVQKSSSPYAPDMAVDSVRILVLDNGHEREDIIMLSEHDYDIDSIMSLVRGLEY